MDNKLYVSNLAFTMRDADLETVFAEFGGVISAKVIMDRFSGRSKGFGFVEMTTEAEAEKAMNALNGKQVSGREVRVAISRPKPEESAAAAKA